MAADGVAAADELEAERVELVAQLGENIVVVGGQRLEGGTLGSYVHPPANKIGVLVQLEGGTADLARQVAMHISFAAPEYTSRDDVPAETVAAERQILLELGRGAVEARAGSREDRRGHAREALLRSVARRHAPRPGVDSRRLQVGRRGARGSGRDGERVLADLGRRFVTAPSEELTERPSPVGSAFGRALLKLSGESLMGDREYGVDPRTVEAIAREVVTVQQAAPRSQWSSAAATSIGA